MEAKRPDNLMRVVPLEKIQSLFNIAFEIQNKGVGNVFLDFQAHVAWIYIRVYIGGWAAYSVPLIKYTLPVSEDYFSEDQFEYIMQELTEIYNSEISFEVVEAKRKQDELERKRKQYEKLKAEFGD